MVIMAAIRLPFHYGWIMVIAGILTLFSCLGLGRFALGMLLPAMGGNLELSYAQMGYISTGNFIGYLLAVLISGRLSRLLGARQMIFWGLMMVGGSMVLVSQSHNFLPLLFLYLITGIGTGAANISVMGLVGHWFAPQYRGRAAGSMIIGNGLGIVCSGLLIPWFNAQWGDAGWRVSWFSFGVLVIVIGLLCSLLLRNDPAEVGLKPLGCDKNNGNPKPVSKPAEILQRPLVLHLGCIYFLFGFSYVIYVTFIVTTLIQEYGFSESVAGWFWIAIGLLSMLSGPLFGTLSDRLGRKTGMILVFTLHSLAYLLAASGLSQSTLFLSIALFGIAAFSIPAIIAATISDLFEPSRAASIFGYVTFFFGIGQITGPSLAGLLAEQSGSFSGSYLMAATMSALAIVLTLFLDRSTHAQRPVGSNTLRMANR
tara:strand:+ start:976 stop:2253 length:1278 start_codon:yes stop_codon:yes gene_type:complete